VSSWGSAPGCAETQHRSHQDQRTRADIPGERSESTGWNFLAVTPVSAKDNRENVVVDQMMYVQSLKLLDALRAQRERERSESIEPDDDAAAAINYDDRGAQPERASSSLNQASRPPRKARACV
jgi:hypothetical protein